MTRFRSSSGRSMTNGRSSDARTGGSQSSRSARISTRSQRSACGSALAASGSSSTVATLAGSRARISSSVAWIRKVTSCRYSAVAKPVRTRSARSRSAGGGSNVPGRVLACAMRSRRKVRSWPIPGSVPVTYQRPEWATIPYGCRVRSLCRASRAVYLIEIGRRWRTASAMVSRTPVSGVANSPGPFDVKARDSRTASSLRARRSGSTRRILAVAVSLAVSVVVAGPARRPAIRPRSTASASSSLNMSGGSR